VADLPERECPICGFSFLPKRRAQETCSVACRNTLNARRSAKERGDALRGRRRGGKRQRYPKLMGKPAHRRVAEEALGRELRPGEVVHHLNGDKTDFRAVNLIVMSSQRAHNQLGHDGWRDKLKRGRS
jgi:predicted nucleic acid-binding Zn ribbon protein